MNTAINQLIQFALEHQMIQPADVDYSVNLLLDLFQLDTFTKQETETASLYDILDTMLAYAVSHGLCENDVTDRDLFDTRIMNCIMPRPSEVNAEFFSRYRQSPEAATDYFYNLSVHSNYIRKSRTDKNIKFRKEYKYGPIEISINLSKPEKDPREIARARQVKASGYPKCLLCKENVGFAGNANHPARQNHRIIPIDLKNGRYYLQYSPYVYYNEHCILLNEHHEPMRINRQTFENLFDFVSQFPHYMAGSNSDIPIVGGSILTHDHYQGGNHHFPIEDAQVIEEHTVDGVQVQMLYWPLTTLRLTDKDPDKLIRLADRILHAWIAYEDPARDIISHTGDIRHNAITPIVRRKGDQYQIDIVLRNNRTSDAYPDGIFHPHPEHHHIKKENIGLIEVMGLAVLPARLKNEMALIQEVLQGTASVQEHPELEKHIQWIQELEKKMPVENMQDFLETELAVKFVKVLENAGVYKMDEDGIAGFRVFVESLERNDEQLD